MMGDRDGRRVGRIEGEKRNRLLAEELMEPER
jgi:hypothetical protein